MFSGRGRDNYADCFADYTNTHMLVTHADTAGLDTVGRASAKGRATDRIGVKDATYRHSWPSPGTVVSRIEGGRAEPGERVAHADTVFTLRDFEVGKVLGEGFFGRVYVLQCATCM